MPPTNDPSHGHLKKTTPAHRKPKSKFQIPANIESADAPITCVYRADEIAPPVSLPAATVPVHADKPANPQVFLVAGVSLFLVGIGTMGLASLAAIELFATPVRLAKRMLPAR